MRNRIRWLIRRLIRFRGRRRHKSSFPCPIATPRAIAYYAAGGIGDIIMAWPAIQMIRKSFPDARLDLFVPPKPRAIIAEVFGKDIATSHAFSTGISTALLHRGYDVALSNTVAAFYLTVEWNAFVSAKHAYGFRYPDEPQRGRLYRDSIAIEDGVHDIDQNRRLTAMALGIPFTLEKYHFDSGAPLDSPVFPVVIHPGVERGYDYKLWPLDRYAQLCRRLIAEGHPVRILIGPSELHMETFFREIQGTQLVTGASAAQLVSEIRTARLFIGNDSGPSHIAAFFNVPAITLIGPVDPARTEPRGRHSVSIYNTLDCSPCYFRAQNCPDNRCMKSISVEEVCSAAERLLALEPRSTAAGSKAASTR